MIHWIRKAAILMSCTVFFGVLFFGLATSADSFDLSSLFICIIKALVSGGLFWFAGFILGDIVFKGVLTDIDLDRTNLLEGGLVQRINEKQADALPGGADMPLVDSESDAVKKIKAENKIRKLRGA